MHLLPPELYQLSYKLQNISNMDIAFYIFAFIGAITVLKRLMKIIT
jgi:hypothetical protein